MKGNLLCILPIEKRGNMGKWNGMEERRRGLTNNNEGLREEKYHETKKPHHKKRALGFVLL